VTALGIFSSRLDEHFYRQARDPDGWPSVVGQDESTFLVCFPEYLESLPSVEQSLLSVKSLRRVLFQTPRKNLIPKLHHDRFQSGYSAAYVHSQDLCFEASRFWTPGCNLLTAGSSVAEVGQMPTAARGFILVLMCLWVPHAVRGQEVPVDPYVRLLLDSEIGSNNQLGYEFPSIAIGPSIEIPLRSRFELQASAAYSPDKKFITNDGQSLRTKGGVVVWATPLVGLTSSVEGSWLWTSQFNKSGWLPSAGVVLRNEYFGPGRLYISYLFPTGCVWATANNPCKTQSNRLQGVQIRPEFRASSHLRFGFEVGIYHFCDQSNPFAPSLGRTCHFAGTALATMRVEFHPRRKPGAHDLGYY
jgi:hypothetical protein